MFRHIRPILKTSWSRRITAFPRPEILGLALVSALLIYIKCIQPYHFRVNVYDTGIYARLIWNVAHGQGYYGPVSPHNHLGIHFSPIVVLLAPLTYIWHPVSVLMATQALAFCGTLFLLFKIVHEVVDLDDVPRRLFAGAIIIMCILSRPMMAGLWFEFHPSTLGMPIIAGMILLLIKGRVGWMWVLAPFLLATKEVGLLSLAGIGIYAGLVLGRWRTALALWLTVGVASALIFGVVMPWARGGADWTHTERLGPFTFPGEKLLYLRNLILAAGLLPLLHWRACAAVLPTTLLNLTVSYQPQFSMMHHYDDQNSVFWFIAAIHGMTKLPSVLERLSLSRAEALVAIAAICIIFRGQHPGKEWNRCRSQTWAKALWAEFEPVMRLPRNVRIITQNGFGAYLCNRDKIVIKLRKDQSIPLEAGDVIVLSPLVLRQDVDIRPAIASFDTNSRCRVLYASPQLSVHRVER